MPMSYQNQIIPTSVEPFHPADGFVDQNGMKYLWKVVAFSCTIQWVEISCEVMSTYVCINLHSWHDLPFNFWLFVSCLFYLGLNFEKLADRFIRLDSTEDEMFGCNRYKRKGNNSFQVRNNVKNGIILKISHVFSFRKNKVKTLNSFTYVWCSLQTKL